MKKKSTLRAFARTEAKNCLLEVWLGSQIARLAGKPDWLGSQTRLARTSDWLGRYVSQDQKIFSMIKYI
jgi:hypothetical protein